jgi:hypothetical protein
MAFRHSGDSFVIRRLSISIIFISTPGLTDRNSTDFAIWTSLGYAPSNNYRLNVAIRQLIVELFPSARGRVQSDLTQMDLSRASVTIPTADSKHRRCDCKCFPQKNVAATPSVVASTHRRRRFTLAPPPNLTPTAHPERMATTRRPFCPSPLCYLPKCWPRERLKRVEIFPPGLFLVVPTKCCTSCHPLGSPELYACHPRPVN